MADYKIAKVEWEDAHSIDEWTPTNEILDYEPAIVYSSGFLIKNDKYCVTLAGNVDPDGALSCTMIIPKKMVRKITLLDQPKKSKHNKAR